MKQRLLENTSPLYRLFYLVLIAFASFGIVFLAGMVVGKFIFKINIYDLTTIINDLDNPQNVLILKYFQILQTIGLFIIPPFIIATLASRNIKTYLYFDKKSSIESFALAGMAMLLALPFINFLAEVNANMRLPEFLSGVEIWMKDSEEKAEELTKIFVEANNFSGFIINLLMIAILPAIGEELIFRGVIQKYFTEITKNTHWGVIIAAFIFSAFHLQFYGFIPRFLMGVFLGYLLVWSKNIWIPIFAHFLNNGAAVTAYYLLDDKTVTKNLEEVGTTNETIFYTIISILIVTILIYFFRKKTKEENILVN